MAFHSKHDKHEQMMQLDRKSLMFHLRYVLSKSFFILTTGELSVNRKDLQAPTLAGPPKLYQGSGPLTCNTTRQTTIYFFKSNLTTNFSPRVVIVQFEHKCSNISESIEKEPWSFKWVMIRTGHHQKLFQFASKLLYVHLKSIQQLND